MSDLIERLKILAVRAAKVAPGPWERESEETEGADGKYNEFVLMDARGYRLCGTENADHRFGEIHREDADEDGAGWHWNEPAKVLMTFLAALDPATVSALLAELSRLKAELAEERDAFLKVCDALGIQASASAHLDAATFPSRIKELEVVGASGAFELRNYANVLMRGGYATQKYIWKILNLATSLDGKPADARFADITRTHGGD